MNIVYSEDNRENVQGLCWSALESKTLIFSGFYILPCKTQKNGDGQSIPSQLGGLLKASFL